jgi:formate hydrogenlyase transcriptional activator
MALILIMSAYLVGEVVRASVLSREVAANEKRWRISGSKGAATILGINPSTLRFRMKKLKIIKDH